MRLEEEVPNINNYTEPQIDALVEELIERKKNLKQAESGKIDIYITAKEVSTILGLTGNTVYILARSGKLKSFKIGGSVRFKKDDLFNFVSSMRSESKYENEAFCEKNCIISSNDDLILFKAFFIYKIMRENKIWIYLYNRQFEHSIRIGKQEFRKYFRMANNVEIDAGKFNLGTNIG
jgi:excisionase family DNA binding protein